jgi:NAD(P) transhydrogenase subunit alpha
MLAELCPGKDGQLQIDLADEVIRGATVTHEGEVLWPPPPVERPPPPAKKAEPVEPVPAEAQASSRPAWFAPALIFTVAAALLLLVGAYAPASFVSHFTVFVLACFVGYMVVWNVTPSLHTPLMSVTNAISSIVVIGALLQISADDTRVVWLAGLTVLITSINIFGGFGVTRRMLSMFRR